MNRRSNEGSIPALLEENFLPRFLRNFSLFDNGAFAPAKANEQSNISLSEDEKNVYVEAHLPGVPQDKIEITQDKGILWIRGEVQEKEENKDKKYYYKATQSFSYRIALPGNIDENKEPSGSYENGVAKVVYPKQTIAGPKKIQIS